MFPLMESWKKLFLKATGFGCGFALVSAIVLGICVWWSSRPSKPKPFDTHAITGTNAGMSFQRRSDAFHFELVYSLHNNTDRDYTLPSNGAVMLINSENGGLGKRADSTWDTSLVIPPGKTVNVTFDVPYHFSDYNYEQADFSDEKDVEFAKRRASENKGMVFYDYDHRIEIDCPDPNTTKM